MKPVCEDGLVTLSRSMNGDTGSPSSFSISLYSKRGQGWLCVCVCVFVCLVWGVAPAHPKGLEVRGEITSI